MVAMCVDHIIEQLSQRPPDRTNPASRPIALIEVTRSLPFQPLMKTKSIRLACLLATLFALPTVARAQGSVFTYQGRLTENGSPTSSTNDFTFTLYNAASGGATVGVSNVVNNLVLSNGLFTVTLDFGAAAFPGNDRWLDIAVRPGTSSGAYTALTPRQPITSTPYALRAANLTGTLPQSQLPTGVITNNRTGVTLSGTFTGNGAALSNVNAVTLNGITSAGFWRTDGNVGANPANGAFLGSADNQALEFKVNGARALRLEPDLTSPNILAGSPANAKIGGIVGAAVLGGGNASYPNTVANNYATVVGGISNTASGSASLAMGQFTTASGYAAVASGYGSTAAGFTSFAGGNSARAAHDGSFVWGDNTSASFSSTANNQFLIRAGGGVGINTNNPGGAALSVNGPVAISGGNLALRDGASSIQFPVVSGASSPMINLFPSGTGNANRMVLAHSPAFANWGLQYQDVSDQFDFLAGGSPVMTVALGSRSVGVGTANPQVPLHIFSPYNPTVVRVQSAGAPGFGRIEFVSNPQGDANEWRPGYIQSLDGGGFTGGLGFYVNGTGADSKFASVEAMRLFASGLYVSTSIYGTSPSGNGVQGSSGSAGYSGVYGENTSGGGFGVAGRTTGAGYAIYGDNANPAGWAGVFHGNLYYSGLQNKLDAMENFTATVRAADFFFGHSGRRGSPGRALVDFTDTLHLNFASDWANTYIGGNNVSVCTLTIRGGCDIAEPFKMSNNEIPKGAVVVIDEDNAGHLKMSDQACDRRVAGIISGANGVNTGVTLTQEGVFEGGQNVALSGRVYVQADASNGSIKPGDLLTTSDVPGHAMKVTDHSKAQGAILGKAMTALKDGRGMVLVLVTLHLPAC